MVNNVRRDIRGHVRRAGIETTADASTYLEMAKPQAPVSNR